MLLLQYRIDVHDDGVGVPLDEFECIDSIGVLTRASRKGYQPDDDEIKAMDEVVYCRVRILNGDSVALNMWWSVMDHCQGIRDRIHYHPRNLVIDDIDPLLHRYERNQIDDGVEFWMYEGVVEKECEA